MTSYSIQVKNSSAFRKSYVVLMQPPAVSTNGRQPVVYSNAWVTFVGVEPGKFESVTIVDSTFAYWATATMPVAPGTTMGQGGAAAIDITAQDSVLFIGTNPAGFGSVTPSGAPPGSYRIIAGGDFDFSNGYLFGLAKPGNIPGIPSPVATFVAEPNQTFDVTPAINFYVVDGWYVPGQILDYSMVPAVSGIVSFAGRSESNAMVIQDSRGTFLTEYY
jgi:hypothetical protein